MAVPDCSLPAGIEDLLREREKLREGRYARMTLLGYAYDIRAFTAWCRRWDRAALPASGETVSLYVTDLVAPNKVVMRQKDGIADGAAFFHQHTLWNRPATLLRFPIQLTIPSSHRTLTAEYPTSITEPTFSSSRHLT